MNYFAPFYEVEDKLDALLAEHGLVAAWQKMDYPLKLVITPNASPEAQMSLLEDDDGISSPNAKLCYTFELDNIKVELEGRLAVPESLMSKIMGHAKKMHRLWLEGYFAAQKDKENGKSPDDESKEEPAEDDTSDEEEPTEGEGNDFDGFYSNEPEPDGQ